MLTPYWEFAIYIALILFSGDEKYFCPADYEGNTIY